MFLDDLNNDGVELPPAPDSGDVAAIGSWFAVVFWAWYQIHSGDEIVSFTILGIPVRKWHYADLYRVFVHVFGPEPVESAGEPSDVPSEAV